MHGHWGGRESRKQPTFYDCSCFGSGKCYLWQKYHFSWIGLQEVMVSWFPGTVLFHWDANITTETSEEVRRLTWVSESNAFSLGNPLWLVPATKSNLLFYFCLLTRTESRQPAQACLPWKMSVQVLKFEPNCSPLLSPRNCCFLGIGPALIVPMPKPSFYCRRNDSHGPGRRWSGAILSL